jgi:hypothetical protein
MDAWLDEVACISANPLPVFNRVFRPAMMATMSGMTYSRLSKAS